MNIIWPKINHSIYCLARLCCVLAGLWVTLGPAVASAESKEDITYKGANYPRLLAEKSAKSSVDDVHKTYIKLHKTIKSAFSEDPSHKDLVLELLQLDQENWLAYRSLHCTLISSVYAYPAHSKQANFEYNICILDLSKNRNSFLKNIMLAF